MEARSTIQKNSKLALNATVLNLSRVSSITFSASAEILLYSSISVVTFLDSSRISIKLSSSKRSMIFSAAESV